MTPSEAVDFLDDCAGRLDGSLEPALRESVEPLHQGFLANYMRRVQPGGSPWPEHAPRTVKKYGPHPLLILKGDMIAATAQEGAPGNITRVEEGGRVLNLGIEHEVIKYAATQNYGRAHVPQREFLFANEDALDTTLERFADAAVETVFG